MRTTSFSFKRNLLTAILLVAGAVMSRSASAQQWATNGTNINNTNTGNVGVGTTTPAQKLTLGAGNILLPSGNGATDGSVYFGGVTSTGQVGMRLFGGLVNGGAVKAGFIDVMTSDLTDGLRIRVDTATGGTERMRITSNGLVGIGTATPLERFHVVGNALVQGYVGSMGNPPNDTTPDNTSQVTLINRGLGGNPYRWSFFTAAVGGGNGVTPNALELWEYPSSGQPSCCIQRVQVLKSASGAIPAPIIIDGAGNLGVGITPTTKLHVAGDVTVTGNINARYGQDLAEWVPARKFMAAGTVVILDPTTSNQVMASEREYDTRVAGVVSARPGVLLGEGGDGKAVIATTGRVKVRVDTKGTPIRIGDLLVTSDREGVAMRSVPVEIGGVAMHRPGTLIGKALEPIADGEGEILVLLSLQ